MRNNLYSYGAFHVCVTPHKYMQSISISVLCSCCARVSSTSIKTSMSGLLALRGVGTHSAIHAQQTCTASTAAASHRGLASLSSNPRMPFAGIVCSSHGAWLPEASPPPQAQLRKWGWQAKAPAAQRANQRGIHVTAADELEVSQMLRAGEYDASQIQV